jgi:hypothetical protein
VIGRIKSVFRARTCHSGAAGIHAARGQSLADEPPPARGATGVSMMHYFSFYQHYSLLGLKIARLEKLLRQRRVWRLQASVWFDFIRQINLRTTVLKHAILLPMYGNVGRMSAALSANLCKQAADLG